jgi:elongation factor P
MLTGAQFDRTFRSGEKFKEADLEEAEMEYLYSDGQRFCFMNTTTYDQVFVTEEQVADSIDFLKENTVCSVLLYEGNPIGISLKLKKQIPGLKAIPHPEIPNRQPLKPDMF